MEQERRLVNGTERSVENDLKKLNDRWFYIIDRTCATTFRTEAADTTNFNKTIRVIKEIVRKSHSTKFQIKSKTFH